MVNSRIFALNEKSGLEGKMASQRWLLWVGASFYLDFLPANSWSESG